jgi:hypothetical protein
MTYNHSSKPVGGSYSDLNKLYPGRKENEQEIHHIPAKSAYKDVTSINPGSGSSIVMDKLDHERTASWGGRKSSLAYCKQQKQLIAAGKIDAAFEMDKADLRGKFGSKYDPAIRQAESHLHQKVIPSLKSAPTAKIPDKLQNTPTNAQTPTNSVDHNLGHPKANSPQTQNSPSSKPSSNLSPNR